MNLQTRNKVDTAFSMASMTDLIFFAADLFYADLFIHNAIGFTGEFADQ